MNALIVSTSEKVFVTVVQVLRLCGSYGLVKADSISQARSLAGQRRFSIAVIYADTRDAAYRELAETLAAAGCGTVFLPAYGIDDGMYYLYDSGVQLVGKPVTRLSLYGAVKTASVIAERLARLAEENEALKDQIRTLRAVGKAKCLLVAGGMTEEQAHKEIERAAMERRKTRLEIANEIIERNDHIR